MFLLFICNSKRLWDLWPDEIQTCLLDYSKSPNQNVTDMGEPSEMRIKSRHKPSAWGNLVTYILNHGISHLHLGASAT